MDGCFDQVSAADLERLSLYCGLAASAFMFEPTSESIQGLKAASQEILEAGVKEPYARELFEHLASLDVTDVTALRTRIATEYAELFIGPRPPLAPIFESVYFGSGRRIMSTRTLDVRARYAEAGYETVDKNRIPDDHLAHELEFIGRMLERAMEADSNDPGSALLTATRFAAEHTGTWIGRFAERVESAYCADYYPYWARFVIGLVGEIVELATEQ